MTSKVIILLCSIAIAQAGQLAGRAAAYGSAAVPSLGYSAPPAAVSGYSINVAHGSVSPYHAAPWLNGGVGHAVVPNAAVPFPHGASPVSAYAASPLVHGASHLSGHLAHNSLPIAPYAAYPYGASPAVPHGAGPLTPYAGLPLAHGTAALASAHGKSGFPLPSSNLLSPYSAPHFGAPGFQAYGTPYSAPNYLPPANNVLPYNAGLYGGVPLPYNNHACL